VPLLQQGAVGATGEPLKATLTGWHSTKFVPETSAVSVDWALAVLASATNTKTETKYFTNPLYFIILLRVLWSIVCWLNGNGGGMISSGLHDMLAYLP